MPIPAEPHSSHHALTEEPLSAARWRGVFHVLRPFLALVTVMMLFCVADQAINGDKATFHTARSMRTVAAQTATVAVAALGMTVIIIAGGIDLSVGMAIALCATVLAWSLKEDVALLLVHGDNVAGATQRLKSAQTELGRSPTDVDLQSVVERRTGHLERVQLASRTWTPWTPWLAARCADC